MSKPFKTISTPKDWTPDSWQQKTALQQASYDDPAALTDALERLAKLPPLVSSLEILSLKKQLAEAQ
ncbi:MAG: 3-deoxy-7-phosphoheptulonate synthase, partial [Pseudomonadota bacterium]